MLQLLKKEKVNKQNYVQIFDVRSHVTSDLRYPSYGFNEYDKDTNGDNNNSKYNHNNNNDNSNGNIDNKHKNTHNSNIPFCNS